MSIRIMIKKCKYCGHRYSYNPSVGNFGLICPHCHKAQPNVTEFNKDLKQSDKRRQ